MSRSNVIGRSESKSGPKRDKTVREKTQVLKATDIFCYCKPPKFELCNSVFGALTMCCGFGLNWFCCYGADRPDCKQVFLAGVMIEVSSFCVFGIGAGVITGLKMLDFFI